MSEKLTLSGIGAKTTAGTGPVVQVGNLRKLFVTVRVTAGSGTVNPFRVWIEQSNDGTNFAEVGCELVLKSGSAAPGSVPTAPQRDIVNETAVVSSAQYTAFCRAGADYVRAGWNIAGTTPSETFEVIATAK